MNQADLSTCLQAIDLPELSTAADRDLMDGDITLEDIEKAIGCFSPCRSTGLEGLPLEWYGMYGEFVALRLFQVFNLTRKEGCMTPSMREDLEVLLPKSGKEVKECDSYYPISLMNVGT